MKSATTFGAGANLGWALAVVGFFWLGIGTAAAESIDIRDTSYRSPRVWEQLTVDGGPRAIVLENVQHVRIAGCAIHDVSAAAIIIRRSHDVTIENCTIRGANSSTVGDAASILIEDSTGIRLTNVNLNGTIVGPGMLIERSRDVMVSGGTISHGLHDGLVIHGGRNILVDSLVVERQWGNGLVVSGQPAELELRDVTVRDAGGDGIRLSDLTSRAILYHSTLQDNAGYGLHLAWGVRELDATGNALLLNAQGGGMVAGSCANRFERNVIVAPGRPGWTISLATAADPASTEANVAGCTVNGNQWLKSDVSAGQAVALVNQPDPTAGLANDNTFSGERFARLTAPSTRSVGAVLGVTTDISQPSPIRAMVIASLSAIALLMSGFLLASAWRTVRRAAPAAAQQYYGQRRQWPTRPILHLLDQWHQRHERR